MPSDKNTPSDEKNTVDISMSCVQQMRVLIMLVESGTPEGRQAAIDELMRLASYVDGFHSVDDDGRDVVTNPMQPLSDEEVTS